MAKIIYALNQSLDGYVDHTEFAPDPSLFEHFIDDIGSLAGCIYGGRMYELMRYWDDDKPEWDEARWRYANAWRRQPKWVVSRTLKSVGPNATLLEGDIEAAIRNLKTRTDGVIEVAGPRLAASLAGFGLIDEYRIYLHPVVLGKGTPFFAGIRPALRLVAHERIGSNAIRLTYVPQ